MSSDYTVTREGDSAGAFVLRHEGHRAGRLDYRVSGAVLEIDYVVVTPRLRGQGSGRGWLTLPSPGRAKRVAPSPPLQLRGARPARRRGVSRRPRRRPLKGRSDRIMIVVLERRRAQHPADTARRREGRHRVLRRPRHQRRAALDAREGRDPVRLHRQPRPARRARLRRDPAQGAGLRRREGAADRVPRRSSSPKGIAAHAVRRVPHLHRRRRPTSTPRRSAAPSPARCSSSRCAKTTSTSGATAARTRATTSSASIATGCSPTRACASTSRGSTSSSSTSSAAARRCRST